MKIMPTYWLFWRKNRLNYFRAFYNSFFARLVTKKWLKVKKWPKKVTKSEEKKWLKVKKWPKKVTKSEEKKWRNFDKKMTKISVPVIQAKNVPSSHNNKNRHRYPLADITTKCTLSTTIIKARIYIRNNTANVYCVVD